MTQKLTKKVNNKRVMKELPVWKCINKTTPLSWFDKYEKFFVKLGYEIGFDEISVGDILKQTGIDNEEYWVRYLTFHYKQERSFVFTLVRTKVGLGGGINMKDNILSCPKKNEWDIKMTTSLVNENWVESRTDIGNWFINAIRENWT